MSEPIFSRRPAVRLMALLVLGILLAHVTELASGLVFQLTIGIYLITLVSSLRTKYRRMASVGLHASVIALGFTLHQFHRERVQAKIIEPVGFEEPVVVLGVIDGGLIPQGEFHRFMIKSSFLHREKGGLQQLERRFLVMARKSVTTPILDSLEFGALIAFDGFLKRMPRPRNPGEFDYGRYLELNDIHGVLGIEKDAVLRVVNTGNFSFQKLVARAQKFLLRIIDRFHTQEHASFIKGVALGYREDISLEMKQSFMDTGTIHILAVSGSNVAVVALMFYSFFGFFRFSKRTVTVAAILGLLFYMVITGMSPSVMRATIMAIVILVGMSIERKTDIYNSLSASGVILLLWDTNYLFDVGFQLSFTAVFSIVYFYPILSRLIEKIPDWLEEVKGIDFVLKLFAVSLAAQLGTLPFSAYYFGKISLISLLANLVVVPLSGINTVLGFTVVVFSTLSDFVAESYAALNDLLVAFLLGFVKAAASVPLAYIETSGMSLPAAVLYFLFLAAMFNPKNKSVLKIAMIVPLVVANFFIYAEAFGNERGKLRMTMLDVGQGDAVLIEFPNDKRMLIDAGPTSLRYDAGEAVVVPFLKRHGIRSLDALLISHPHADHYGGISAIIKHFNVGNIVEGMSSPDSGSYRQWIMYAQQLGITTLRQSSGMQLMLDASTRIYILHPRLPEDSSSNENNSSLVLKVVYGTTSVLLTGDAELETEEKLIRRFEGFLSSQVLKAGHHGSVTSSGEEFVRTISPQFSLVSVGVKNKFRHPSSEVMHRLSSLGSNVLRTDQKGAIILESDGTQWRHVNWR